MTKKDGSIFSGQRSYLSNGDAKGLIAIQPPIHFTFERDYPTPIFSPYKYETTKYLRCPENTKIKFGIAKRFEINYDLFKAPKIPDDKPVPPSFWDGPFAFGLGSFSLDEFDIKVTISIQKKDSYYPFYKKEIPFTKEIFKWEEEIVNIDIPKGLYSVKVSLTGKVKGTSDLRREKILERILYSPKIFFKIEEVQIGGKNIFVPKDVGNDATLRRDTFIEII
ncbi:hypothetical protein [Capnocytophaga catalasegens]|uniref:Uncharacterized protein n=1 Tax=Capnocytophaga catalasegens TaxID=1004260 RepID=A0AAV5AS34_9FLAO|nr:hypothetical protein [Capnocytophaga catalasegens]GIZ14935.1 hypothetical protein RCZ03_09350 [Capnocytophaga catalasegens]GJM49314.1 hypothetical protein RCZ15_02890 [Capnocytophaga catalasegens]GJM52465.1 hypothetical protein RCZ16_07820 [Capnocytophaga catalasegens]